MICLWNVLHESVFVKNILHESAFIIKINAARFDIGCINRYSNSLSVHIFVATVYGFTTTCLICDGQLMLAIPDLSLNLITPN